MAIIVDGYNLLNAIGLVGRPSGPSSLHQSRTALLNFLAAALPAAERRKTVVVFDALRAPPGLADRFVHQDISVRFARGPNEADDLIEEMIRLDFSPRQLTVVSSDHRIQRAARRRRARAVDSEDWYLEILRRWRKESSFAGDPHESLAEVEKPTGPLSPGEVQAWLKRFGIASPAVPTDSIARELPPAEPLTQPTQRDEPPAGPDVPRDPTAEDPASGPSFTPHKNPYHPFPPGYGEDLLADDDLD